MANNGYYFYLEGADESFVKLNPLLSVVGYEFLKFTCEEFEDRFYQVFQGIASVQGKKQVKEFSLGDEMYRFVYSEEFEKAVKGQSLISYSDFFYRGYIMLLRDYNKPEEENEVYGILNVDNNTRSIRNVRELVTKLRLFKTGYISLLSSFYFFYPPIEENQKEKKIEVCFTRRFNLERGVLSSYLIEDNEIDFLSQHLLQELNIPPLLQLAIDSFNEFYDLENDKLRFVLLMIALESIFNKSGQDPIQHIMSRHVGLTLTSDKDQFEKIFKEVKELYQIRSLIVHGKTEGGELKKLNDLPKYVEKLEEIVRSVLKKLIWLYDFYEGQPTKDKLFNYLNSKGFEG